MSLVKALYDHVKKNPGKTSREISVAFDGYIMGHYYSRASVGSALCTLVAVGQLRRELPAGRVRGGTYFVDSYFDIDAINRHINGAARQKSKPVIQSPAPKRTIDRDTLRVLTRKHARAYPYNVPGSQLVHQSLYDLCLELGVTVTGS
jgi:hypothetical protein